MRAVSFILVILTSFSRFFGVVGQSYNRETSSQTNNNVEFLWPVGRNVTDDNTAPCGNRASTRRREEFPIGGGNVALIISDKVYQVKIRISYKSEPNLQDDFEILKQEIDYIAPGHQCYNISNIPSKVKPGDPGTLQLEYLNDIRNMTYFSCADIVFVERSDFDPSVVPCFNVTEVTGDYMSPETGFGVLGLESRGVILVIVFSVLVAFASSMA